MSFIPDFNSGNQWVNSNYLDSTIQIYITDSPLALKKPDTSIKIKYINDNFIYQQILPTIPKTPCNKIIFHEKYLFTYMFFLFFFVL